jgi:glycosyltransferase involved in cell wall biosynthesis
MNTKIVVYIGGFELPDKNAAAHRVISNGKILKSLGYEVYYIGIDKCKKSGSIDRFYLNELPFGAWSMPYPLKKVSWIKYIIGVNGIVNLLNDIGKNRISCVICYNYPAISQLRIYLFCKLNRIKILSDSTEWYDSSGGSFIFRLIKRLDTSLRIYFVNKLSDGVITTSKYMTNFYSKKNIPTLELPTLFDSSRIEAPLVGIQKSTCRFIYIGSPFDPWKVNKERNNVKERLDRVLILLGALFKKGYDFQFSVYGITEAEYLQVYPEHKDLIFEMSGRLKFYGLLPNTIVIQELRKSDFMIFFRDKSRVTLAGFPSKLAESITCGVPVVVNKMLSIERYSETPGLILTENGNEQSVVSRLIEMPNRDLEQLKLSAYECRVFHFENYIKPFKEFFRDLGIYSNLH